MTDQQKLINSNVFLFCSTILEEEKLQQKERSRMEMRRQVTVSWDSGGSDEAPPKVRRCYATCVCVCHCLSACLCLYEHNRCSNKEFLLCLCCLQWDTLIKQVPCTLKLETAAPLIGSYMDFVIYVLFSDLLHHYWYLMHWNDSTGR